MEHITIVIDRSVVAKYNKYYFKKYTSRRKSYFMSNWKSKRKNPKELYGVLSLNDLLPIAPRTYNSLKKQWKDFGIWLAKEYKLNNKKYKNAIIEYRTFAETKAHKDNDNVIGGSKLLSDGLYVESGMFKDDSYYYINPIIGSIEYDKENPRLEIRITICDEKVKDVYEKMQKHIKHFSK